MSAIPTTTTSTQDQIEQWRVDANRIGIDMNTIWTQWIHVKALVTAIDRSPRAREHPESFYLTHFIFKAVVEHVILGIRRQVDEDKRSHSFRNLLRELMTNLHVFTVGECVKIFAQRSERSEYTKHLRDSYETQARARYAAVADDSGICLDMSKLVADNTRLTELCETMKLLANKAIAHNDKERPEVDVTIKELDDTVNGVKQLMRKYTRLLDGGGAGDGEPDMEEMLSLYRFAWLETPTS